MDAARKTLITWLRDRIGLFSLIGCPFVLVTYLALHHGLNPVVGVRAIAALYFLGVAPGYLAQRFLFRVQVATPFETLLSSLLLGSLVTPFLWYALCWAGWPMVFFPMMLGLGLVMPMVVGWYRDPGKRLMQLVTTVDAPVLWLGTLLVVVWSFSTTFVETDEGKVLIKPHYDLCFHATQVTELARAIPPEALPFLAGTKNIGYHYMPHEWCDMMRRAAGSDPREGFFYLALPLRYLLLSLACYLALVRRFGRWAAWAGVACMLAFVEPARFAFPKGWLIYLHYSYPTTFGLVAVFLILYYVSLIDRLGPRIPLLLVSLLSGLLTYYKVNHALAVIPAVTVLSITILAKRRDFGWLVLCITVQGVIAGLFYLHVLWSDLRPTMVFAPLAFVEWWWQHLALPPAVHVPLREAVERWPSLVRWPAVLLVCMVHRFHIGLVVTIYLVIRCGFARARTQTAEVDRLFVVILLVCVAGFILFPIQEGLVWNISMHVWALVSALLFALMGPAVFDLLRRLITHPRKVVVVATMFALLALLVNNTFALRRVALWETRQSSGSVSTEFYDCCQYIETSTPQDATILHPEFRQHIFVSMLTQRRSVFEYAWLCSFYRDIDPILADLDTFYRGTASGAARIILDRYNVDYVIANRSRTQIPTHEGPLGMVFQSGEMAVYRVLPEVRFTSAHPTGEKTGPWERAGKDPPETLNR